MTRVLLTGDRHGLEHSVTILGGFPGGSEAKNLPGNVGDMYLILGLGRSHMPWSKRSLYATTTEPTL